MNQLRSLREGHSNPYTHLKKKKGKKNEKNEPSYLSTMKQISQQCAINFKSIERKYMVRQTNIDFIPKLILFIFYFISTLLPVNLNKVTPQISLERVRKHKPKQRLFRAK